MSSNIEFTPSQIEIEINANCNMSCSYCPNSIENRNAKGQMSQEIFELLLGQLKRLNYKGIIAFHFYNEPTLAENFDLYTKRLKEVLPECHLNLFTNGTKINSKERLEELYKLGVDYICITKHEGLKTLPIEKFLDDLDDNTRNKLDYRQHDDIYMTNRGGLLSHVGEEIPQTSPCLLPSMMMTITVDGNVLSCFEDFNESHIMGNIKETPIDEIWSGDEFETFRQDLKQGLRSKYDICKDCNRVSKNVKDLDEGTSKLGDEELQAVERVIKSGQLFRYQRGKGECDLFEDEFCKKFGAEYAYLINSGTNAIVLALKASEIGPGDEVIIPSYTFIATAAAVVSVGAIPVVANIDDQLCLSVKEIKSRITENTKAIIPVHMDGICCDLEKICAIAKDNNLVVIEDACQAIGAIYKGKRVGTWGDFGCFSFNQDKVLTCGEGGLVICKTREHYEKMLLNSDSGYSFSPMHQDSFEIVEPFLGGSMRVSEISGAIMRVQLSRLDTIQRAFIKRKNIFLDEISGLEGFKIIRGHDPKGECHISLFLKFDNPEVARTVGKKLRNNRVLASPPNIRPAHFAWKWGALLNDKSASYIQKTNPYTESSLKFFKADFLPSVDILYSTLKINMELAFSIKETIRQAKSVREALEELSA